MPEPQGRQELVVAAAGTDIAVAAGLVLVGLELVVGLVDTSGAVGLPYLH